MERSPKDSETLAEILAQSARDDAEAGPDSTPAPEPEELLDFLEDRLPPEEARRLDRRVVADPEASRALLDLADFAEAETSAGSAPPEVATHAGWRDFQKRLQEAEPTRARPTPAPPWLMAVAAGLLVAVVGLGAWVWTLRQPPPLVVAQLESLDLVADVRGEETVVPLAPGVPLRLVLRPEERHAEYRAEIRWTGPAGETDRRVEEGLVRDDLGLVTLLLSGRPGEYELILSAGDPPRELERHRFLVGPESDGG